MNRKAEDERVETPAAAGKPTATIHRLVLRKACAPASTPAANPPCQPERDDHDDDPGPDAA